MAVYTIFGHDTDTGKDFCLHVDMNPPTQRCVWLHVLQHCMSGDQRPASLDDVQCVLDDLGEDAMDLNVTAVLPGIHTNVLVELPEH